MSQPDAPRYRTTNWKSYNDALRRRGSLLIRCPAVAACSDERGLDKDMEWRAPKAGRNGRPPVFTDAAIQFCLVVKVLFGLPLRQTTGMVSSILSMAGLDWPVPDFSTLSRRQKTIEVQISNRRVPGPLNLLVDIEPLRRHRFEPNGEGASSSSATGNGWRVSTARIADASIARACPGESRGPSGDGHRHR